LTFKDDNQTDPFKKISFCAEQKYFSYFFLYGTKTSPDSETHFFPALISLQEIKTSITNGFVIFVVQRKYKEGSKYESIPGLAGSAALSLRLGFHSKQVK